jgi:hypothetical protein
MTAPDVDDQDYEIENPLIEGDSEYTVRLVIKVNAFDPEHARNRFIAKVNEFGLNSWTYQVTTDTDQLFLVQHGDVLTPQEFAEQTESEDALGALLEGFVEDALDDPNVPEDGPDEEPGDIETVVDPNART